MIDRLTIGIFLGISIGYLLHEWTSKYKSKKDITHRSRYVKRVVSGATELIGHTPIVHLPRLSALLNVDIYAKCEFMNPGGSSKDRVALKIMQEMKENGYGPKTEVFEGTVGSTGISIAWISKCFGYTAHICMPDDQAREKYEILERMGAKVTKTRPCSIVDPLQFVNVARSEAKLQGGVFANQFENLDNFKVHYETTGPEIYEQMKTVGLFDVLVMGAGTGGTLAGCTRYLKPRIPLLKVVLADPPGSGLYYKVKSNVFFNFTESEGKRRRHQVDTVVEGVGINRMTQNLKKVFGSNEDDNENVGWIDDAVSVSDKEAVYMSRYIMETEGLFLGSSSCVNLVACVKYAKSMKRSPKTVCSTDKIPKIVTMLPDAGFRHLTKFWNTDYLVCNGVIKPDEFQQANLIIHLEKFLFASQ